MHMQNWRHYFDIYIFRKDEEGRCQSITIQPEYISIEVKNNTLWKLENTVDVKFSMAENKSNRNRNKYVVKNKIEKK